MSGKIIMNPEFIELFTTGRVKYPKLSMDFPAQHITTKLEWNDIVLNESTLQQISELEQWIKHHHTLMQDWGMMNKLKPGYRALFYGPPGTGKTLTATLLGKYTGKEVFKIDLSMVVSKFIGETEKNLSHLFARAENKNWILFFDEADALFSKRTNVRDAHDKYANQEAAYLLQRIENFDGLVILATNFKNNIDEAFIRRFHSVIHFAPPTASERLEIWLKGFSPNVSFSKDVDMTAISKKYELTGSSIMSVVQYACLSALGLNTNEINNEMILSGIRREYQKEGKIW
jgi:SpoVK/Ycf46/Vps4 family AAA+-type ATPase